MSRGPSRRPAATARGAALRGLLALSRGKRHQRLATVLDLSGLDGRDRALAWELALGTERHRLLLDFVLAQFVTRHLPRDPLLATALRLGAYQLLQLTRIPARAVVHETVALLGRPRGFANAVLRRLARAIEPRAADPRHPRRELSLPADADGARCLVFANGALPPPDSVAGLAVRHGLPEFLVERWVEVLGLDTAATVCAASSGTPSVSLRATDRAGDSPGLGDVLAAEGVAIEALTDPRFYRVRAGDPFSSDAFAAGLFIAQDKTAFAAAAAVGAQPGETILDLCAAPGTKSMVLAEAVGCTGRILAHDPDPQRRPRIAENAARLRLEERISVLEGLDGVESVDRVLVDAPCSNTGVLSRRVEVRHRLRPSTFDELARLQRELLGRGMALCRSGGIAVYSTCSIEPEENRGVVDAVLAVASAPWQLRSERLTLPRVGGGDGGYFAVLRSGQVGGQ